MRKIALTCVLVAMATALAHAQTSTNSAGGGSDATSVSDIRSEIEQDKKRRAKELKRIEEDLRDKEIQLDSLLAKMNVTKGRVPALERQEAKAREKLNQARMYQEEVDSNYSTLQASARDKLAARLIAALNHEFGIEYREQLAAYERDKKLVDENRWKESDFDELTIKTVDAEGKVYRLQFKDRKSVSGYFPTANSATGDKTWHKVPARAVFETSTVGDNPFVCRVTINPGFTARDLVCTNNISRNVDIFLAKHYAKHRIDAGTRYELLAVAWHVDLNRTKCVQFADPPVFMATPEPTLEEASTETEEISEKLSAWEWEDPGWEQRKSDGNRALKEAQQLVRIIGRKIPEARAKMEKRIAELEEEQKTVAEEIEDLKNIRDEYIREEEAAALGGDVGAPLTFEEGVEDVPVP